MMPDHVNCWQRSDRRTLLCFALCVATTTAFGLTLLARLHRDGVHRSSRSDLFKHRRLAACPPPRLLLPRASRRRRRHAPNFLVCDRQARRAGRSKYPPPPQAMPLLQLQLALQPASRMPSASPLRRRPMRPTTTSAGTCEAACPETPASGHGSSHRHHRVTGAAAAAAHRTREFAAILQAHHHHHSNAAHGSCCFPACSVTCL